MDKVELCPDEIKEEIHIFLSVESRDMLISRLVGNLSLLSRLPASSLLRRCEERAAEKGKS